LAGSIRDVGAVGRRESVGEARCRCGFGEEGPLPWSEIHGERRTVWLTCLVDGPASF
jgi:hypothetical protein